MEALGATPETVSAKMLDKWVIQPEDVHKEKKIAEGGYGEVWKGRWHNIDVAIKAIKGMDVRKETKKK